MTDPIPIEKLDVSSFTIPTDFPESDGTLEWDKTTLVVVEARAGDKLGLGYTYSDTAAARLLRDKLVNFILGRDAMAVPAVYEALNRAVRNLGRPGIASMAISAVDAALWDLKARLLGVPLVSLLGELRERIPVYGSGGFSSYSVEHLDRQLRSWADGGINRVKMKIGRDPSNDLDRVRTARQAIGPGVHLFVDANGAYRRKQALAFAEALCGFRVTWFEEPVSSDDLEGLRLIRERAPAGMDIAAGEYGYDLFYYARMLRADAVDVLQADATRCGGITGFLKVGALCEAHALALSAHTAPSLHAHLGCALKQAIHVEYFHDHARIEEMLFDGFVKPSGGALEPDRSRRGMGLELKRADAEWYADRF